MRIVFAGTASFAMPSLEMLVDLCQHSDLYELVGVYTQPDRPKGRGRLLHSSPVKQYALTQGLNVYQPVSLKVKDTQRLLAQLHPDLIVVVAYGLLLPQAVLDIPALGCINVHGSLLPRWRGAAPIQRALLEGDVFTGVTIMQMDAGLDTGPIFLQNKETIQSKDTAHTLEARLSVLGADALRKVIQQLSNNQVSTYLQSEAESCYAAKLMKQEGVVHWSLPAVILDRQIRAFNPWPVSTTMIHETKLKIWEATPQLHVPHASVVSPGEIVAISHKAIIVATGEGYLALHRLQREGGRDLPVSELLNGSLAFLKVGMRFDNVC